MKKCIVCGSRQRKIFSYKHFNYYKCDNCGHVTTYPLPTKQSISKHYSDKFKKGNYSLLNSYSQKYNKVYEGIANTLLLFISKKNKPLLNKRVLDVGCFTGDLLVIFKRMGADVYGLELQKEAVKIANERLPKKVFEADVMSRKFNLGEFDIVTLTGLVEHVTNPVALLNKVSKITKRNGYILIQTPNGSSFPAKLLKKYWPPYSPVEHIHLFTKKSLEMALEQNGFEPIYYKNHWKSLPISYVYNMLENFGPEFHSLMKPLAKVLSKSNLSLPFYVGEMIVIAKKT